MIYIHVTFRKILNLRSIDFQDHRMPILITSSVIMAHLDLYAAAIDDWGLRKRKIVHWEKELIVRIPKMIF